MKSIKEVHKLFRKVIPNTGNYFNYNSNLNQIVLDGIFCSDELRCIADTMDTVSGFNREIKYVKSLNINNITYKNIKVGYVKDDDSSNKLIFSFYVMKDGRDYDFYYGSDTAGDWWPIDKENEFHNPLEDFIPAGFYEICENTYKYEGSDKEALELLKKCGFTLETVGVGD